jgi:hypothetical protein
MFVLTLVFVVLLPFLAVWVAAPRSRGRVHQVDEGAFTASSALYVIHGNTTGQAPTRQICTQMSLRLIMLSRRPRCCVLVCHPLSPHNHWHSQCKLFRFTDAKAWALVGHGEVQILQSNDTGKMYLRMRGHGQTLVNQFGTSLSLGQV